MQDIVRALSPDLYRFAYWLCRDRSVAEDLTQEAFLRAWANIDSLRDPSAIKAWLMQIIRNEHMRRFRKRRPDIDTDVELDALEHAYESDFLGEMEMREALAALPLALREPLVLQVLGGYTGSEIGAIVGVTEDAALTRVSRAKQALRKILRRQPGNSIAPVKRGAK